MGAVLRSGQSIFRKRGSFVQVRGITKRCVRLRVGRGVQLGVTPNKSSRGFQPCETFHASIFRKCVPAVCLEE